MILEGVIGIVEGLNPTLIRMKLEAYQEAPAAPRRRQRRQPEPGQRRYAKRGVPEPAAAKELARRID